MIEIKRLPEFDKWLNGLKDQSVKARLIVRLKKHRWETWVTLGLLAKVSVKYVSISVPAGVCTSCSVAST